jgi:hypothetical protein
MLGCTCLDWEPNIRHMKEMIELSPIFIEAYNLTQFQHCPWCGKKLIKKIDVSEIVRPNVIK